MCETRELALEHSTARPLVLELHLKTKLLVLKGKSNARCSKASSTLEALDTTLRSPLGLIFTLSFARLHECVVGTYVCDSPKVGKIKFKT